LFRKQSVYIKNFLLAGAFYGVSITMDPWMSARNSEGEEKPTLTFEDNFEPSDRLPDSVAYLSALGNIFYHVTYVIL
jgi:hypothetical protein